MSSTMRFAALGIAAASSLALLAAGCGESRKIQGGVPPGSELNLEIQALQPPAQGTGAGAAVTFRATDRFGAPIDVLAELANAPSKTMPYVSNGPRFTLSQMEPDGSHTNLFEAQVAAATFTAPDGSTQTPNRAATQPLSDPPSSVPVASRLTAMGNGVYMYQFSTTTTPSSKLDPSKTLTVGMWMERTQSRQDGGGPKRWPAAATRNFAGSAGGTASPPHEAVVDAACNTCHVVLRAHDRRQTVQLCRTCHTGAGQYRDPESNESIDLRAMIHRIHNGKNLPSVLAGGEFFIVGFRQSVSDFSDAFFPPTRDPRECTVCHHGGTDSDDWKNKASFIACTSCHDEIRFDGSAPKDCTLGVTDIQPCEHPLSPSIVNSTSNCATCHSAGASSPDIGPDVVHQNPTAVAVAPWKFEIVQVTIGNDRKPVVQFRVTKNGVAQNVKTATEWMQGSASRLFVDVAWPTTEYTNEGAGFVDGGVPAQGEAVQINALTTSTAVAGQDNVFQVTSPTAIPSQFTSATIVLEGHPALGTGTSAFRVPVPNAVQNVGVGGPAVERRRIVSADNCNACHGELSAHGSNRSGTPAVCVVCHTPRTTDYPRWFQAGSPANPPEETIDFKVLVHEIHGADIRRNPVTIIGFGGSPNEFPAAFPGQTGRCTICHVDASYALPLRPEVLDTTVKVGDPSVENDPAEQYRGKTQAVCLACHDAVHFDTGTSRPICNTLIPVNSADCNHTGGAITNDANCAACHATGQPNDVAKVHAIEDQPQ